MSNDFWSRQVQGTQTLYRSRKLRFCDHFREAYTSQLRIDPSQPLRILEIGCGPGALAGALHRWYPNAQITAIDRDSSFIAYAREQVPGVTFLEADAAALPFPEGYFDVTISNTVSEHIPPEAFYGEQRRVLKPGGLCAVLSARRGIRQEAPCLAVTEAEEAFWQTVDPPELKQLGVGLYACSERELPLTMEAQGFSQVSAGYVILPMTPDDPFLPAGMGEAIIEALRSEALEPVLSTGRPESGDIARIINDKFDRRLELLHSGIRQWDTCTAVTMLVQGIR